MASTITKLQFSKFGEPSDVLELVTEPVTPCELKPTEARIRVLLTPIHPADFLTIRGALPVHSPFPIVSGKESVVEVIEGHSFQPGDLAITLKLEWGSWRQEGVIEEATLVKIPRDLPLEAAVTLATTPTAAHLLLTTIVQLQPGDVVIHNGANSGVGRSIIQLAKAAGIRTISVIRDRPNSAEIVDQLKSLGADAVITTDQLAKGLESLNLGLSPPKLALECVGGRAAFHLVGAMGPNSTVVLFGILSGEPSQFDQMTVIMRNIRIVGFALQKWRMSHSPEEYRKLLEDSISLYQSGKLQVPAVRKYPVAQWRDAIEAVKRGFNNEKIVLKFN